jgi:hypothetical protein
MSQHRSAMLKHRRENRVVCWTCHGRTGPNHFTLRDDGAVCSLCASMNPLGNLRKMSIQEVTEPCEIIVCFTQSGKAAHALHIDCKTTLGPWINFQSAETLEKALVYLGGTEEQMTKHRDQMLSCGQGSSHIRLLPLRKNLLRIDWGKL